jgi:hypothetical protein
MLSQDTELQGTTAIAAVPDWLSGLIRAVRSEAVQPKDTRVKSLWDLLRQRQLLDRSRWLRAMLRDIWIRGLPARERPRMTRRLVELLQRWGILSPRVVPPTGSSVSISIQPGAPVSLIPVPPVVVRPFRPRRPIVVRPVRPVTVRPVARPARRR